MYTRCFCLAAVLEPCPSHICVLLVDDELGVFRLSLVYVCCSHPSDASPNADETFPLGLMDWLVRGPVGFDAGVVDAIHVEVR